jgi:hypothetical protein
MFHYAARLELDLVAAAHDALRWYFRMFDHFIVMPISSSRRWATFDRAQKASPIDTESLCTCSCNFCQEAQS